MAEKEYEICECLKCGAWVPADDLTHIYCGKCGSLMISKTLVEKKKVKEKDDTTDFDLECSRRENL